MSEKSTQSKCSLQQGASTTSDIHTVGQHSCRTDIRTVSDPFQRCAVSLLTKLQIGKSLPSSPRRASSPRSSTPSSPLIKRTRSSPFPLPETLERSQAPRKQPRKIRSNSAALSTRDSPCEVTKDVSAPSLRNEDTQKPSIGPHRIRTNKPRKLQRLDHNDPSEKGHSESFANSESVSSKGSRIHIDAGDEEHPSSPAATQASANRKTLADQGASQTSSTVCSGTTSEPSSENWSEHYQLQQLASGIDTNLGKHRRSSAFFKSDLVSQDQQVVEPREPQNAKSNMSAALPDNVIFPALGSSSSTVSPLSATSRTLQAMRSPYSFLDYPQSAFDYAIQPPIHGGNFFSRPGMRLPSLTDTSSYYHLTRSPSLCSSRNQQVFPLPLPSKKELTPVENILQTWTPEKRLRLITLRTVLLRCAILSGSNIDQRRENIMTPQTNYHQICRMIKRDGLPIAESLGETAFIARCYYWVGRGHAGLEEWDAAIQAFRKALQYNVAEVHVLLPRTHQYDTDFWLRQMEEQKRLRTKGPDQKAERLTTSLQEDILEYFDAVEDGDVEKANSIAGWLRPVWEPDILKTDKKIAFTKSDWVYIKSTPRGVRRALHNDDRVYLEETWKRTQNMCLVWADLWKELAAPNERLNLTDRSRSFGVD